MVSYQTIIKETIKKKQVLKMEPYYNTLPQELYTYVYTNMFFESNKLCHFCFMKCRMPLKPLMAR